MDSGSGKSIVTRIIEWLRGLSDSQTSKSRASSGQAARQRPATPDTSAETVPQHLPSTQANVPPNAASLDLTSSDTSGSNQATTTSAESGTTSATTGSMGTDSASRSAEGGTTSATAGSTGNDFPSPGDRSSESSEAAPPSTNDATANRKIDEADPATSATASSSLVPPGDAASAESLSSTDAQSEEVADPGDVRDDARQANYGRGNLEVGAKGSVGSSSGDSEEFTLTGDQDDTGTAGIDGDATAEDNTDLDATELGTLEDTEPVASEAGMDPPPEQPAGLSATDLVAGASNNLTSAQQTLSTESSAAGTKTEPAMNADAGPGEAVTPSDSDQEAAAGVARVAGVAGVAGVASESSSSTSDNSGTTDTTDTDLSLLSETDSTAADPAAAFAAGLSSAETGSSAESTADIPSASEAPEDYARADAFDSVDSTGIFGLADQNAGSLDYLRDASLDAFEAAVEERPESTGLFGLRDTSTSDLNYLSGSESNRYDFDAVSTNDVSAGNDFDASSGSPASESTSSILTDQPSGGTAAASEMAPDSEAIVSEATSTGVETSAPLGSSADDFEAGSATQTDGNETATDGDETAPGSDQHSGDDASPGVTDSTADPESLLAAPDAPSADTGGDDALPVSPASSRAAAASGSGPSTTPANGTDDGRVKGVDGVCPPDFPIKGNASSKVYHVPGLPSYEKTKAEWCFSSEDTAISFGYRAPGGHRNQASGRTGDSTAAAAVLQHTSTTESTVDTGSAVDPLLDSSFTEDTPPTTTSQHADLTAEQPASKQENTSAPEGSVAGDGTRTCPAEYPIKGNGGSMIYHVPGTASYDATIPEWCFATEDDAIGAGYRAPRRR
jgi:hypothetical protein